MFSSEEAAPAIEGIDMPGMVMLSTFASSCMESRVPIFAEWRSDWFCAKLQDKSHAAAIDETETDRSNATIDPANMRFIVIPLLILREKVYAMQRPAVGRSWM
jgi:hypothetical protein